MHLLAMCTAVCAAVAVHLLGRRLALVGDFERTRKFEVGPGVRPLAVACDGKKCAHDGADTVPLSRIDPGDAGEDAVRGRQSAVLPVVHDEMQVGAALRGIEVRGLGEVVGDVKRHPGSGHLTLRELESLRVFPPGLERKSDSAAPCTMDMD